MGGFKTTNQLRILEDMASLQGSAHIIICHLTDKKSVGFLGLGGKGEWTMMRKHMGFTQQVVNVVELLSWKN